MIIQPHVLIKLTNIKNDLKLSGYVNRRSVREEDQRRFQTFIQFNSILFRVLSLIWKNVSFGESILPNGFKTAEMKYMNVYPPSVSSD